MMKYSGSITALAVLTLPMPSQAQSVSDEPVAADSAAPAPVTVSGSASIASDYRFRGVSQADREMAVQGGLTIAHASGVYPGTWGSNLAGWGTFGGANMQLDLIGGYKAAIGNGATIDAGLTWYMYPGGADISDREAACLRPSFSRGQGGTGTIAGGTLVASLAAAF
jgi:uncharacterized protein (TIGR02001 family)